MQRRHRWTGGLIVTALIAAGCGASDEATDAPDSTPATTEAVASTTEPSATTTPPPTAAPPETIEPPATTAPVATTEAPDDALTGDLCSTLALDQPPGNIADLVAPEHAEAATLLIDLIDALDAAVDTTQSFPPELIERFADPASGARMQAWADATEAECGPSEAIEGIRFYGRLSGMATPVADDAYCEPLSTIVSLESSDEETLIALDAARTIAPPEHLVALDTINDLITSAGELPAGLDLEVTAEAIGGLGLYAEARCGIPQAFASMMFVATFLSEGSGASQPGSGLGTTPAPADPASAIDALPPDATIGFEVVEIDLDLNNEGDYLVSAVVPTGWEREDTAFGITFEPGEDFSVFTELAFDTGCDGLCEVTDWEARLTAPDGFITLFRESGDLIIDEPTEGTAGIVMTKPGLADGIDGIVIRWADGVDKYFVCEFDVDGADAAYTDTLLAACLAAQPGWITG